MPLSIRAQQMRAFETAALAGWIEAHIREFFPEHCQALGPAGLARVVEQGIAKAARLGFTDARHCCQFVKLTIMFGEDFERTEPWAIEALGASEALAGTSGKQAELRIGHLFEAGMEQLRSLAQESQ